MTPRRTLTIVGATGNQGGSVIDAVLAHPALTERYGLRGITRNLTSSSAKALTAKGVELVQADLDDPESLQRAMKDSHGVFAVTDYWHLHSRAREVQQGKNVFLAAQASGVKHLVYSTLPNVSALSGGKFAGVHHFDGKAEVAAFIKANKENMIASYFMPAMFLTQLKGALQVQDGTLTMSLPFPNPDRPWPLLEPRLDTGKYVMGLFESEGRADGVRVQGVSTWTTPNAVVSQLGQHLNREVKFKSISGEEFEAFLPELIREDVSQMMQWIGEGSYYGLGSERNQETSSMWLLPGSELHDWPTFIGDNGPWEF